MTAFLERESASDLDLISAARDGDEQAVAELYVRHHDAAARYARGLADPTTAEDLVAEAFARLLENIRAGGGPEVAFRPYLLRTVHNVYVNHVRRDSRHAWVEDVDELDGPIAADPIAERQESTVLAAAFASLPERWQTVLWHTVVEGDDHETVGRLLGIKANAVAALAFRARDGLRQAYLGAHLGEARDEACKPYREELAPYARGRLRGQRKERLESHLAQCPDCTAGYLELHALGADLGAALAPAVLGVTATTYVAGSGGGGAASVGLYQGRGLRSAAPAGVAAAAAVLVVVVAAAGAAAWTARTGSDDAAPAESDPAVHATTSAEPSMTPAPAPPTPTPTSSPSLYPSLSPPLFPMVTPSATAPTAEPASPTPSATPSATPTPPATPKPTRSPSATPTTAPTATPTAVPTTPPVTPTVEPTVEPTPTPDPTTHEDLRLGSASHAYYGPHHHVQMSVAALLEPTVLTIDVLGLTSFDVHDESTYLTSTCTQTGVDGDVTRLTCEVSPGSGTFAIDVVVSGALDVTVRVSAEGNEDPDPTNDVLTFPT